ncbi:YjbF family lipoprotein [Aliidiomarina minuta]|uniref:YjbF family lipoprotein n=1 Tax=Aliidiomarina minuta TaxID=880057 RepID=A0A432W8A4_9GAMM|nr:YjbF family lipoprotein [Aliidiomarina minuta]RUO26251.1 YjbF family lipoprotein [Aliidiomarina minuta]
MSFLPLSAKSVIALCSIFVLGGCTAVTDETFETIKYAFSSPEDATLTEQQISDFPYTAMYARWDDSARLLVVLGYADGEELSWITAENETLITRGGRVVRTADVDTELLAVSNLAEDPLQCVLDEDGCNMTWTRYMDIERNQQRYSRRVHSDFSIVGEESLQLPDGKTYQVTRVEEHGELGTREFVNVFWLEADGHVVRSRQQIIPERAALELTQVKWVGRD